MLHFPIHLTETGEKVVALTATQQLQRWHKKGQQGKGSIPMLPVHQLVNNNNKKRSHTQLDSRKQVIAFQDRVMTINIKEAQHPLKREKQVIDKSSIMLKISTKSMHRVLV